jgi:nicotinamidase-related amidase
VCLEWGGVGWIIVSGVECDGCVWSGVRRMKVICVWSGVGWIIVSGVESDGCVRSG